MVGKFWEVADDCLEMLEIMGKVAHGIGKVAHGIGKVAHGIGKVAHGIGKVAHGIGKARQSLPVAPIASKLQAMVGKF
jgi:hypothetical protein